MRRHHRNTHDRNAAASSEAILLTVGVAVAVLLAVTMFGWRSVGLQKASVAALDGDRGEPSPGGGSADPALHDDGKGGPEGAGGAGGAGAKGGAGGERPGISLPPGARPSGTSPLEGADDLVPATGGAGGKGGAGGSGGPGGSDGSGGQGGPAGGSMAADTPDAHARRARELARRGQHLAARLADVPNESDMGRQHRRDLEALIAELVAREDALRRDAHPDAAAAADAVKRSRLAVENDRDRALREKQGKALTGLLGDVFGKAEADGLDTGKLRRIVDEGKAGVVQENLDENTAAEWGTVLNNVKVRPDQIAGDRVKPDFYPVMLHELLHGYVDVALAGDADLRKAFEEQEKNAKAKKWDDKISAEGVADELAGNWLHNNLIPNLQLIVARSNGPDDAAKRMTDFLANPENRKVYLNDTYVKVSGYREIDQNFARELARLVGVGPDDLRRRWPEFAERKAGR